MDIERNLNNRPLTYVRAEGEEEVLTPNVIVWGRNSYPIEDSELFEDDKEKLTKMNNRLEEAKAHARRRWKREYIHSLMKSHRLNKEGAATPVVEEVVRSCRWRRKQPWRVEKRRCRASFEARTVLLEV